MPNWKDVLDEINHIRQDPLKAPNSFDLVRREYLQKLFQHTGRNIIAYYSGFLSKPNTDSEINDEDKNGFMMAVHQLDRKKGLDLILHTPGGSIAATQSIVNYLHKMFDFDIRAIVPQIAMSAGTMIACSCKSILMGKQSNLGPIDPQLRGVPARGVIEEFRQACKEIKKDSSKIPMWQSIIGQYRPTFLSQCSNAIKWSDSFVKEQLECVMFKGYSDVKKRVGRIVRNLSDYRGNKTHNRHIHFEECEKMGLIVEKLEDDRQLQDLVLTTHHCFMHSLMNTVSYKIVENQNGTAFVKQEQISVPFPIMMQKQ